MSAGTVKLGLGVEEQFYLLWPLLMLALFIWSKPSSWKHAALALLGICLVSFCLTTWLTLEAPRFAFYQMPSRIWQFALGSLVSCVVDGPSSPRLRAWSLSCRRITQASQVIGLVLIGSTALLIDAQRPYPGVWALLPTIGAALVIAGGGALQKDTGILRHRWLVWLGDRSYSLYLWHWPVIVLAESMFIDRSILAGSALALLIVMLAAGTYRFVELPFWKGSFSYALPRRTLLLSALCMSAMVLVTYRTWSHLDSERPVSPFLDARIDSPEIYSLGCDDWYLDDRVRPCVFGSRNARNIVVLIGDSVGAQWFSMVPILFPAPEWRTVVFTKSSCPLVDEDFFYERIQSVYEVCTRWRNGVIEELAHLSPDVVFLGNAYTYGFDPSQWIDGTKRILARISPVAHQVYLIAGTPKLPFSGPACLAHNVGADGLAAGACEAGYSSEPVFQVASYLEAAAGYFSNVQLLNFNSLVCPGGVCRALTEDGTLVFRDTQHLTDSFVRSQVASIRKMLAASPEKLRRAVSLEQ